MRRGRKEEGSDDEGPPVKRARSVRKSHIEAETSTRGQIRQRETTTSDEPSKRAKVIDRDKDGYYAGNIIKITCRNFMTYDDMTIIPSPRLNLIIGPNGTGKSSLVCAIGLGLAGEPKSLGRAGSVGDYVQRGKPEAVTEITIRGGAKQEVFKVVRRFNTENKSVWSINGVTKIKEDVKRLCQEYDIQIGNLTQFLPQDRVTEFAKMTPVELLRETEKAVDERLHKQHEELIAMQAALHMLDTTVKQHDTTLGRHKALNAELEKDVERINMREEMLAEVEIMEMKLPWLIYDRSKEPFRLAREDLQRADRHLESVRQHFEATAGPFREMSKRRDALKREGEEMVRLLKEKDQQRLKAFDKVEDLATRVAEREAERASLQQQAQQRQARLDRAKRELAAVEVELAAEPEHYQPPVEKLCSLRDQINAKRDAIVRLQQDARSISYQQGPKQSELQAIDRRLQELSDTKHRRIRAYNDRDNDLAGMWRFLEDNRSTRLKGPVYGPLLIEISSPESEAARQALEQHVPKHLWKAVVTTCDEDRDLMRKLYPNATTINIPGGLTREPVSVVITDEMRALGITHTLDQVFDAPALVKSVLCTHSSIHRTLLGSMEAERPDNLEAMKRVGADVLYTPSHRYQWHKSHYHSSISMSQGHMRPCRWLGQEAGGAEIQQQELRRQALQQELGEMEQQLGSTRRDVTALENQAAEVERERNSIEREFTELKLKRTTMVKKVEQRRKTVQRVEQEEDPQLGEARVAAAIGKLNDERFAILRSHNLIVELGRAHMAAAAAHLSRYEVELMLKELERKQKGADDSIKEALAAQVLAKRERDRCRAVVAALKDEATRKVDIQKHPDLQQKFETLPGTVEELEEAIRERTAQANAVLCPNPNVVKEYEDRKLQIADLEEKLERERGELAGLQADIQAITEEWVPALQAMVARISATFSRNFGEMAVAGEVSLDERGADYGSYGILIKVKFRENGELQVLSAHHQSGGERSVSTILYLVSLQDLTHCPFRVVDEINQGMDPNNERKMFQQLVRAASKENTAQCFLLTPKLLPSLEYGASCSVINIMNGPWIEPAAEGAFKHGASLASALRHLQMSATA